jgi:hypothetical protein
MYILTSPQTSEKKKLKKKMALQSRKEIQSSCVFRLSIYNHQENIQTTGER